MQFNVPEMSCGHCTAAIETSINAADPDAKVTCDLAQKRVKVATALSQADVEAAIRQAGYDAALVPGG